MYASPRSAVVKLEESNHYQDLCEKLGETLIKQRKECIRLEFTGSYYDETKVDDGLEFDIMLIMDGSNLLAEPVEGHSGFVHLKPKVSSRVKGKYKRNKTILDKGNISSKLIANKFQGMLESCMKGLEGVSFKKHGPAVQMDVKQLESELENATSDVATSYQVDLVPTYQIPDQEHPGKNTYYVAKPIKKERMPSTSAWLQTFSIHEKKQFQEVDKADEGNRRMCLRILKALCKRDAPLNKLNSYYLKTVMYHEWDEHPEKEWNRDYLGQRIMDALGRLEIALAVQFLPHFYIGKKFNLFEDFKEQRKKLNCENMLGRVRRLRVSKYAFLKCINVQPKKRQKMDLREITNDEEELNSTSNNAAVTNK